MCRVSSYIDDNINEIYEAQKDKYYSKEYMRKCLMNEYADFYKKRFLKKYKNKIHEFS